jgi:hypothetical protein
MPYHGGACRDRVRYDGMITPFLWGFVMLAQAAPADASALCAAAIEKKMATGMLNRSLDATDQVDGWTILQGRFATAEGMPPASPGYASTHHLIRIDHRYICWIHSGRVRKLTIDPQN